MQTIVQDLPIAVQESHEDALAGLPSTEQVKELMLLYQLCIKLLGCGDPNRVVEIALDLLKKRTGAAVVGFLSVNDEGGLQPKLVIPQEAAGRVSLNQSLTELVSRQGHAVWVANQATGKDTQKIGHFADGVCAPLVRRTVDGERTTLGAIHVYLEEGRFRQSDFDFIISVANIVAIALVRALELTTLQSDYQRLVEKSPGYENSSASVRRCATSNPRSVASPRRPAACWCAAKVARARSSWPGRFTAPARASIARWSP